MEQNNLEAIVNSSGFLLPLHCNPGPDQLLCECEQCQPAPAETAEATPIPTPGIPGLDGVAIVGFGQASPDEYYYSEHGIQQAGEGHGQALRVKPLEGYVFIYDPCLLAYLPVQIFAEKRVLVVRFGLANSQELEATLKILNRMKCIDSAVDQDGKPALQNPFGETVVLK